jgi:hypothetical protein
VKAWPLRGRESEVGSIGALLRGGATGGVVLCGQAGVGKSRLAEEAVRRARARRFRVVSVTATRSAAAIPFGALAPVVDLYPTGDGAPLDTLLVVRRSLRDLAAGSRLLLHVDDAHLLDEPSAAVVHQLVAERHASAVMTLRTGEQAPDAVTALWKDGLLERIDVRPLDVAATQELLEAALGGPVRPGTTASLHAISGGNLLYLRELVRSALDDGALTSQGGAWRLTRDLPPSRRLIELVSERLALAEAEDRQLLTALALAEPLGIDVLTVVTGAETSTSTRLGRIERAGLVLTGFDDRRLEARLAHPLYGEVLRATMPSPELADLRRRLAAALQLTGMQRDTDALRAAALRLDAGVPVDPTLALVAARHARAAVDLTLAERLARVALEGGSERAGQLMFAGDATAALAAVTELLDDPATSDRVRSRAAVAAAPALVLLGRPMEGAAAAAQGIDATRRLPPGVTATVHAITLEVCRSFALRTAGLLDEAAVSAQEAHAAAVANDSSLTQALAARARGQVDLARGSVTRAVADFHEGAAIDAVHGMRSHQRWNLTGEALATAQTGDHAAAKDLLRQIDDLPPGADRFAAADLARARAWTFAAGGAEEAAVSTLRRAAADTAGDGHLGTEAVLLHDMARLGQAEEIRGRLTEVAGGIQGCSAMPWRGMPTGWREGTPTCSGRRRTASRSWARRSSPRRRLLPAPCTGRGWGAARRREGGSDGHERWPASARAPGRQGCSTGRPPPS